MFALAGNNGNGGNNAADSIYTHTASLYEVTASNNGTCTPPAAHSVLCTATGAANTYNGPTGWGTPNGLTAFESNSGGGNTVTVTNPGSQTGTVGTAVSLQITATDSASGQTLTYSATGLPTGLSINASTGLISGHAHHGRHLQRDGHRQGHHRRHRIGVLHLDHQLRDR